PPECSCVWTDWIDVSYPTPDRDGGDYETFDKIEAEIPSWECAKVENISCRATKFPNTPIADLGQKVECSVEHGLICKNKDQTIGGMIPMPVCLNYAIRVCCTPDLPECIPGPSSTPVTTTTTTTAVPPPISTTTTTVPPPSSTTTTTVPPTSTTTTPSPPSSTTTVPPPSSTTTTTPP
ncbi:MUC2 protein, partial [Indicator maculatus]|nr:MUC2 protein [Indicator maculatus]